MCSRQTVASRGAEDACSEETGEEVFLWVTSFVHRLWRLACSNRASRGLDIDSQLKKVLSQATRDLKNRSQYNGLNGGALIPLYDLDVRDSGAGYKYQVGCEAIVTAQGTKGAVGAVLQRPLNADTAKANEEFGEHVEEQTFEISVGRIPTPWSCLEGSGGLVNFGSFDTEFRPEQTANSVWYESGAVEDLVVPALLVRVIYLGDATFRSQLTKMFTDVPSRPPAANLVPQQLSKEKERWEETHRIREPWLDFLYGLPPPRITFHSWTDKKRYITATTGNAPPDTDTSNMKLASSPDVFDMVEILTPKVVIGDAVSPEQLAILHWLPDTTKCLLTRATYRTGERFE